MRCSWEHDARPRAQGIPPPMRDAETPDTPQTPGATDWKRLEVKAPAAARAPPIMHLGGDGFLRVAASQVPLFQKLQRARAITVPLAFPKSVHSSLVETARLRPRRWKQEHLPMNELSAQLRSPDQQAMGRHRQSEGVRSEPRAYRSGWGASCGIDPLTRDQNPWISGSSCTVCLRCRGVAQMPDSPRPPGPYPTKMPP